MMRIEGVRDWSEDAGSNRGLWVAAVTVMVMLFLGAFAGLPRADANSDAVQRGIEADTARYQALAEFYAAKSETAHTARWVGLANSYGQEYTALANANQSADLAGYWAALEGYQGQESAAPQPSSGASVFDADRIRTQVRQASELAANPELMAAGRYHQASELAANPELMLTGRYHQASELAANPELMVAGRYHQESHLAANPELMVAGRYHQAQASELAANPELMVAGRYQSQGLASCTVSEEQLAANPELIIVNRISGC